jgi:hypothetical protein
MFGRTKSPYLKDGRLGDVLAAIQIMGVSDWYRRKLEVWTILLSGDADQEAHPERFAQRMGHWRTVFQEHPEFFRPSGAVPGAYALGIRRGLPRRYHVRRRKVMDQDEIERLTQEEQAYLTRTPLSLDDMKKLVDMALALHEEANNRARWLLQLLIPLGGSIVVGLLSFAAIYLKAKG